MAVSSFGYVMLSFQKGSRDSTPETLVTPVTIYNRRFTLKMGKFRRAKDIEKKQRKNALAIVHPSGIVFKSLYDKRLQSLAPIVQLTGECRPL